MKDKIISKQKRNDNSALKKSDAYFNIINVKNLI